MLLRHH